MIRSVYTKVPRLGCSDGRPRRSVLYVPGSNDKAMNKSQTLKSDCLLLDLEDAVGPSVKVKFTKA